MIHYPRHHCAGTILNDAGESEGAISSITYKGAGVDVAAGAALVDAIAPLARATARPGAGADLGGFAGIVDLAAAGFRDPLLVAATDGVGTKLAIAQALGRHDGIGIDLVAMCVNDVVVSGAEPLFFLDYLATGRLEATAATEVIAGIAAGCRIARCALIGGETAEMPGFYPPGRYDLAGFAVGAVARGGLIDGHTVTPGDTVLGLASDGLHANGFSLVRRVLGRRDLDGPAPFAPEHSLGEALLTPTRIYVRSCLAAVRSGAVKALAHITGGGLVENLARVLPEGQAAVLDARAWALPPVFGWLAEVGPVASEEMIRTFNCGIGMAVVTAAEDASRVTEVLTAEGERVHRIGVVTERPRDAAAVIVEGAEAAWRG